MSAPAAVAAPNSPFRFAATALTAALPGAELYAAPPSGVFADFRIGGSIMALVVVVLLLLACAMLVTMPSRNSCCARLQIYITNKQQRLAKACNNSIGPHTAPERRDGSESLLVLSARLRTLFLGGRLPSVLLLLRTRRRRRRGGCTSRFKRRRLTAHEKHMTSTTAVSDADSQHHTLLDAQSGREAYRGGSGG